MDIEKVAHLARLDLSADEIAEYGSQLGQVLKYIEQLDSIDIEGIEPTAHAAPVFDVVRADIPQPERRLTQEQVLDNAPASAHEQIKMPKVIE